MTKLLNKLYQKKIWLVIALIVFAVQLLIPAYMIFEQNQTLKNGELYKFKIRPIDPYDPFRGRYVVLTFDAENNRLKLNDNETLKRKDWVYALLDTDTEGYAKFSGLTIVKPDHGHYLRVQVRYSASDNHYHIEIPFDRYYAPENKAYAIETSVRQRSRRNSEDNVYVAVKVRHGKGTIEDLLINEIPILEFVEKSIDDVQ